MKNIFTILLLCPLICDAQLSSIVIRNDTTFSVNPSTGVWTPLLPSSTIWSNIPTTSSLNSYSLTSHLHTFSSLTSKPTTLLGYGITDAYPLSGNPSAFLVAADIAGKQATLVSGSNIKTVNGATVLGSTDIVTTRKVAQADIASTASATSATTLFTPLADGFYRVGVYLKITTTGTSPVAGPVTITYQSADGSVAQSHVMLLQSVTGTVVTTTVNNSTTTGTVNGSMVIYAKAGVAIQYAIAVSGTFGAGRYMAHLFCEQL